MLKPVEHYEAPGGVQIDSGVPVPKLDARNIRGAEKGPYRLAMETMEVGQSFFVPNAGYKNGSASPMSVTAATIHRKTKRRFTTRQSADGVRVWRIA